MNPQPTHPTERASRRARWSAPTTVTAAVRMPLTRPASRSATGKFVSQSLRTIRPLARSRPRRSGLSCLLAIHFRPAIGRSPSRSAGIAMIRSATWPFALRRRYGFSGWTVCPRACSASARRTASV